MSRLIFAASILALLLSSAATGQARFEVSGVVVDTTDVGLSGATVMVLDTDSTLISFGITRPDGRFRLGQVPAGDRVLQISFIGFETYTRALTVSDRPLDAGTVVLHESLAELEELMVTADHIPLLVRRDTLDFNASAFRVPANANVEELLRRLPGIEVDGDGTIRAQGEVVRRVLVDGREFFGNDPTVATRNLPAGAVDRVQVYDQRSETAELTGVDDGEQERTINLQLREDHRRGAFGNVSGALGDPQRYETRGSVNRFSPATQISFIGNVNNINQQGFQHGDYATFVGGPDRVDWSQSMVPISQGQSDGFSTTLSGGVNVGLDIGTTSVQASYLAYFLDREQDRLTLTRELAGGQPAAFTRDDVDVENQQRSHRLRINARHEFGEGHDLRLVANSSLGGNTSNSFRSRITDRPEGTTQNENLRRYDWESNTLSADAQLVYRRRLAPGRTVVAELRSSVNDQQFDTDLESTTIFFQAGDVLSQEEIRQIQDQHRNLLNHSQKLTYTEPLGRRQLLEFEVEHRAVLEDRDYATFDLVNGQPVVNVPQSLAFDRTYRYYRGGATFRRSVDPLTFSVGAVVQQAGLQGETLGQAALLDRTFLRVLPTASLRYQFSQHQNLSLNYRTSTREPSMQDLQPFANASDPLNVYFGNPDVRPQYQHSVFAQYFIFDAFSSMNASATVLFDYIPDAIVSSRFVDDDLRQSRTVVNADGIWNLNVRANVGRPIRALRMRGNLWPSVTFSRGVEFVNGEANTSHITRPSVSLWIDNMDKDVVDVRLGASLNYNDVRYSLNPALNQSYLNQSFNANAEYRFAEGWRAGTGVDYHLYAAEVFGQDSDVLLLRAHLAWDVPRTRAELRLEGRDLLNQNVGVNFVSTGSHIREERTASLGRFVMLRMVYNLAGQR